jgi:hypothetical protein
LQCESESESEAERYTATNTANEASGFRGWESGGEGCGCEREMREGGSGSESR